MYIPEAFNVSDPEVLAGVMRRHSFATIVSVVDGEPAISHLPLILDSDRLIGHFARANHHWRALESPRKTVAIFHGPHAYVSPSTYATRPNVPTWAYVVVHAHGTPRLLGEEESVDSLIQMVETFDPSLEATHPETTERDYVAKKARGIVAFEMKIERLEGKFKVGQNKVDADRQGAGEVLALSQDPMLQELGNLYLQPPNR